MSITELKKPGEIVNFKITKPDSKKIYWVQALVNGVYGDNLVIEGGWFVLEGKKWYPVNCGHQYEIGTTPPQLFPTAKLLKTGIDFPPEIPKINQAVKISWDEPTIPDKFDSFEIGSLVRVRQKICLKGKEDIVLIDVTNPRQVGYSNKPQRVFFAKNKFFVNDFRGRSCPAEITLL
ncbi:MAG: hypothetical protein WC460_01545 [Patescibacteria group bacterium]